MARSFAEAILRGLAGAGEELGNELEQNRMFNIQRGDKMKAWRADAAWRKEQADRSRYESDRAYNFDVKQADETRLRDLRARWLANFDAGAEAVESRDRFDITEKRLSAADAADDRYRTSALNAKESLPAKANPAGEAALEGWLAGRLIPNPQSTTEAMMRAPVNTISALDTLRTLRMNAEFPKPKFQSQLSGFGNSTSSILGTKRNLSLQPGGRVVEGPPQNDLETWGASEYGEDWDSLTAEEKMALARKNGWQ